MIVASRVARLQRVPLASARIVASTFARIARPERVMGVAQWAEERRFVSPRSGSPAPGKWSNARTPYGREIMDCLDPEHPARVVTLMIASQMIKSEIILNWICATIDVDPAPMMLALPSINEVRAWNQMKWEPTLEVTPAVSGKVRESDARQSVAQSSTTNFKHFPGGFLAVVSAGSSKELQAKSVKRGALDEVSEWPADTGGRGDPVDQVITRADAHADAKFLIASTPAELPTCRVTKKHEAGDRREFYVPCPDCDAFQTISVDRIIRASDVPGARGALQCVACGVLIAEGAKEAMLARGVWLKRYPSEDPQNPAPPDAIAAEDLDAWIERRGAKSASEGRQPSFWLHQGYSPFKSWTQFLDDAAEAERGDVEKKKTYRQQKLGLAWDPATDAPDHAKLFEVRGAHIRRGVVPSWACMITGAADVQNQRIEWAAYVWGPDGSGGLLDWGIIDGDTSTDAPWFELGKVIGRRWRGEITVDLGFDAFGVDTGGGKGRTAKAYQFVARSRGVHGLKGSSDKRAIPFSQGSIQKKKLTSGRFVRARVDFVGGHEIKHVIHGRLARTIEAAENDDRLEQGLYYPHDAPEEIFKQLTAEIYREPKSRKPGAVGDWERIAGRPNEHFDLAVYCYALAFDQGLDRFSATEWAQLFAARLAPRDDAPLLQLARMEAAQPAAPDPAPRADARAQGLLSADASPEAGVQGDADEAEVDDADDAPPSAPSLPAAHVAANPGARANPWATRSPFARQS